MLRVDSGTMVSYIRRYGRDASGVGGCGEGDRGGEAAYVRLDYSAEWAMEEQIAIEQAWRGSSLCSLCSLISLPRTHPFSLALWLSGSLALSGPLWLTLSFNSLLQDTRQVIGHCLWAMQNGAPILDRPENASRYNVLRM